MLNVFDDMLMPHITHRVCTQLSVKAREVNWHTSSAQYNPTREGVILREVAAYATCSLRAPSTGSWVGARELLKTLEELPGPAPRVRLESNTRGQGRFAPRGQCGHPIPHRGHHWPDPHGGLLTLTRIPAYAGGYICISLLY